MDEHPEPSSDVLAKHIVASAPVGIWVIDPRGRTLQANGRAGELLGRTPDELAMLSVADVLAEADAAGFRRHLAGLAGHDPDPGEVARRFRMPDGSSVRLLVGESELRDDDGRLIGYVQRLIEDDRRLTELDELSRSRALLADAQAIARIGSWEIDAAHDTVAWSPQLFEILGVDPAATAPSVARFFDLLVPEDRAAVQAEFEAVQHTPGERSTEARIVLPDGSTRWLRIVGRVLEWDGRGSPRRIGGTAQDIDEQKETELELRDAVVVNTLMQFMATAANRASTLREAMVTLRGLLLGHPDWRAAVAFEVRDDDVVAMDLEGQDEPDDDAYRIARRALAAGEPVFEEEATPQNPSIAFPVFLGGVPLAVAVITACSPFERHGMLRTLAEQIAAQLGTVAEREAAAVQLAAARDDAMQASRAKTEFVATMSHEIRTPLNGVIGLNDLLLHTALDARQRRLAEGIQGAGRALLGLITDVLDFSKIEAGALELERVPFRLRDVVEEVVDLARPQAEPKGIGIEVTLAADVPDVVLGDPGRFRQVLGNLVANAVKFTGSGSIEVRLCADDLSSSDVELRTEVTDTGIGLAADQLARIFDPFRQADSSTTRDYGGSGLGLTIARRLTAALGGELDVTSTPGRGSTFWFTARFGRTTEQPAEAPAAAPEITAPVGGHLLVVEDNETNQLVAVGMLERLGHTVDVATDGAEGVRRAGEERYDAVLMDLQMPGLDGFASTRMLREREGPGVRVPVIAVTASATPGEWERCLAAGMDGLLTKPLSIERLDAELSRHLASSRRPLAGRAPAPGAGDGVLDPERLDELAAMGDAATSLIRRAADGFAGRIEDDLAELATALADGDGERLRAVAHRIEGSAGNLGVVGVAACARRLQESVTAGRPDDAPAALDALARAVPPGLAALLRHPALAPARTVDG